MALPLETAMKIKLNWVQKSMYSVFFEIKQNLDFYKKYTDDLKTMFLEHNSSETA